MPLFMAQLGYSTLYIGIVPLFGFITRLIVVPLGSYVSDKFQIRRLMLFLCIVISIPTILLFLAPKGPDVPCKMSPLANSSIGINNTTKSSPMSSMFHDAVFHNWLDVTRFQFFLILLFLRGTYELLKNLSVDLTTEITHEDDKEKPRYYGCWGELGAGISLFVVGLLAGHIFHLFCGEKLPSYYIAFLYAAAVQCLSLLALPCLKYEYREKRDDVDYDEIKRVLHNPHYILILLSCAHTGFCTAFQYRWEFWYIKQLGGNPLVMAVSGLLRRTVVAFWFILSGGIIGKLGELNVIAISLSIFAATFAALAFMENAWFVVVLDNFQAASSVLTHASIVVHMSKAGSETTSAFLRGKLFFFILSIDHKLCNICHSTKHKVWPYIYVKQ